MPGRCDGPVKDYKPFQLLLTLTLLLGSGALVNATDILEPSASQGDTLRELIRAVEKRHYSGKRYNDLMSSQHFDAYLDALDPQRMFFDKQDISDISYWQLRLDDAGDIGNLKPAFVIFNLYQKKLHQRLEKIVKTLPSALQEFDFKIEESVVIDRSTLPWADSDIELDERWRKRLKNQVLSLRLADKDKTEIPKTLKRRYQNQLNRLDQYNNQDVFQIYANTLAEQYDPHTNYFSPRRAENFDINMSLSFEGIGAILQIDDEYAKITRLVPAGPAEKQGDLKPSDLIIGVGQGLQGPIEDVIGWRLDEVVDLIRGPRETIVRLEVIPGKGKTDESKVVPIERNKVKLEEQAAKKEVIEFLDGADRPHKIGVIDVPAFYIDFEAYRRGDQKYRSTTRDVQILIDELISENVEGLVIDLRDNGGGSLQEANRLTGLFIEYGPTVQIRSAERRVWRDGKRQRSNYYDGPLAVMVNRLSASASEIFAGAIQDYGRGIVVGEQSFGKGTVQSLVPLKEGQLKITESKFYRVSGDSTQHRGVIPDIYFPSLFDPTQIGESALDNALAWDRISPASFQRYRDFDQILPKLTTMHNKRASSNADYRYLLDQVEMARKAREITSLPLLESGRLAMRDEQESKALEIENRRRFAKGMTLLKSLESKEDESQSIEEVSSQQTDSSQESDENSARLDSKTSDVLLIEAGRILVDSITISSKAKIARREP